jgi:SAM-dependent methyltransferase
MKNIANKKVCANLGCGSHIIHSTNPNERWINIDAYIAPENTTDFISGNLLELPLADNSVDYIISDQVLEHIAMCDIPVALHEIRRVLKVGGRAVIIVPDFRDALNQWLKVDHDQGFNPFFFKYLSEVIYGNQNHDGEYHRTPMSSGFLNYSLRMVGFRDIKLIMHPAFGDLPNYPGAEFDPKLKCRNAQLVADIIKL